MYRRDRPCSRRGLKTANQQRAILRTIFETNYHTEYHMWQSSHKRSGSVTGNARTRPSISGNGTSGWSTECLQTFHLLVSILPVSWIMVGDMSGQASPTGPQNYLRRPITARPSSIHRTVHRKIMQQAQLRKSMEDMCNANGP